MLNSLSGQRFSETAEDLLCCSMNPLFANILLLSKKCKSMHKGIKTCTGQVLSTCLVHVCYVIRAELKK